MLNSFLLLLSLLLLPPPSTIAVSSSFYYFMLNLFAYLPIECNRVKINCLLLKFILAAVFNIYISG